jgi:hypothetical protein
LDDERVREVERRGGHLCTAAHAQHTPQRHDTVKSGVASSRVRRTRFRSDAHF